MPKTETRYERLDAIERHLARRPEGCTTTELAREFQVDSDTIRRDLNLIESRGTGLIKQGRRYFLDHRRIVHTMKISDDEALAIYLAARLVSRHSDEHNPHVVSALDKLSEALHARSPLIASHISRAAAAVRERPTRREYVRVLEVLTQGWAAGRKVRLRYHSYNKDEVTERKFAPYFIEPSGIGYACYVIGFDDLRSELRTLKIERIYEAVLTDEAFTIPDKFDPYRLLISAWGVMWNEGGGIEVVLRFAPSVVRRLKESVWHISQRIEDCPDGSCLFTVSVGNTVEMKPWIRQWGAAVEVLAPEELRIELANEARELVRVYSDTE
ncbi:helix-turn-helix transcriptional regulator [Roseiflexus sp.]|uniref:helix-turn-helix transcriptional regulator n=1 Tax=Roseiflexus sp. TaxID=2562120 RepID=UPI00398B2F1A